jgi:PBP1b-binding outer membrane lipoprotein LpoB
MNKTRRIQIILGIICLLAVALAGCSHAPVMSDEQAESAPAAAPAPSQPASSRPTLTAIAAVPDTVSVNIRSSRSLMIVATYDNDTTQVVTARCDFTSDNPGIAQVTIGGLVSGAVLGSATITVSYTENNVTKTVTVPVTVASSQTR